jgi:hypothetical protein
MSVDASTIRETEHRRLKSLVEADLAVAESLHAEDYQLITPSGYALTKQDYLGAIANGELRYQVFEPVSEIMVRTSGQIALLRYQVQICVQSDGGPVASIRCWHTDTYELRDGHWQAVWSQATLISSGAEPVSPDSK